MRVEMHDRDRASHRIVKARHGGKQDRVITANHGGDASVARLLCGLGPGRGERRHQVVRDNGRVARIVQLPEVERDNAVLVDPVDPPCTRFSMIPPPAILTGSAPTPQSDSGAAVAGLGGRALRFPHGN